MLKIPEKIEYILENLEKNGFEAYIVGGCVRDMLLHKTPHDFDVTTNARPEEICNIFERTVPTGIKHGTVTVILDGTPVEVTTYRTEGKYTDRRRPDTVSFVSSLEEDLARRDFTVNALAYSPSRGLRDCFGGLEDVDKKLLRAVGDPEKRFCEDALRILRLFRFSSVLGFKCEESTLAAALKFADTLSAVSAERIFSELYKCVNGKAPSALSPLISCGGLEFLNIGKNPDYRALSELGSSELKFFAFLYLSGDNLSHTLNTLKASNKLKAYCTSLERLCHEPIPEEKAEIKKILCEYGTETFEDMLSFKATVCKANTQKVRELLNEISSNREPYLISHLAINGNDLKSLGLRGDEIGKALKKLQQTVIRYPELNSLSQLQKIINRCN